MKAKEYELPEPIDAPETDYLYVGTSGITGAGKGLFTAIPIFQNEIISIFKGEVLTDAEANHRKTMKQDGYFISMLDGTIMDSLHVECFAKYANDAEAFAPTGDNNSQITVNEAGEVCLVATRDIDEGEEIYTGYGHRYWKDKAISESL